MVLFYFSQFNGQNSRNRRSVEAMMQHLVHRGVLHNSILEPAAHDHPMKDVVLVHAANQTHKVSMGNSWCFFI